MQRRRGISEDELNKVIKLKEAGLSWLKIQDESGVPRRSAKLAYEKWQKSQSITELKAARINVATEIFKGHIQALVNIAGYIAIRLTTPSSTHLTADQFIDSLLEQKIGEQNLYDLPQTNDRHRSKSVLRHNQLLFKALQDHIREKIRWAAFNEWRTAWGKFLDLIGEIRITIREEISDLAGKEFNKNEKLLQSIRENSGNQNPVTLIVDTIVDTICQDIIESNLRTGGQVVEITSDNVLSTHVITSRKDNKAVFTFTDGAIAKEVSEIFCSLDEQVRVLHVLAGNKAIGDEINRMQTAIKELDEMLSPIILYPILLNTRCDFCPV